MLGKIFLAIFVFFALITAYVFFKIFTAPDNEKEGGIFTQIKHLIMSSDKSLAGEDTDRINILLMGVGGGQHEGPYLTDTMMLVSVKPSTKQVGMLSIPRDLYVNIPNFGTGKINTAYALTRAKQLLVLTGHEQNARGRMAGKSLFLEEMESGSGALAAS